MAGPSWVVDKHRIATKIKSASGACGPGDINWKSNPTKSCPNCQHAVDNSDVNHEWPGLPRGVKFDPSDQEVIWHLLGKAGVNNLKPHPFIDEFIPTVNEEDGICYTHPQNLPGVKQDGTVAHFFHRAIKAYNTGTRKRRKIQGDDLGDFRWHKTGRTKPVVVDGVQRGCKKIMVLYVSPFKGGKAEKTNWVMHQYHLGTGEDEMEGDYVISKVFYQQQQIKQNGKDEEQMSGDICPIISIKADPVTPKLVTPDPPRPESRVSNLNPVLGSDIICAAPPSLLDVEYIDEVELDNTMGKPDCEEYVVEEICADQTVVDIENENVNQVGEDPKWWDSESQHLLDSQQLVEGLSLCDEFLQSQSPNRDGAANPDFVFKPRLADYAHLGPEHLKKDLEACQDLAVDPATIELDTPPDFRLSQLDFGSQESFLAWGRDK